MTLESGFTRTATITLLAVCLGLGAAGVPASALAKHSDQHRYLTEQKTRTDIPGRYEPLTFAEFLALPAIPERYTASEWDTVRTQTQRSVSLEGYIAEVIQAADGATYGRPPDQGGSPCSPASRPAAAVWRWRLTEPADRHRGDPALLASDDRLVLRGAPRPLPASGASPHLGVAPSRLPAHQGYWRPAGKCVGDPPRDEH
jgi:hypothetical protein